MEHVVVHLDRILNLQQLRCNVNKLQCTECFIIASYAIFEHVFPLVSNMVKKLLQKGYCAVSEVKVETYSC